MYDVKVYNANGKLKKVIPKEAVKKEAWRVFNEESTYTSGVLKDRTCIKCGKTFQTYEKTKNLLSQSLYKLP